MAHISALTCRTLSVPFPEVFPKTTFREEDGEMNQPEGITVEGVPLTTYLNEKEKKEKTEESEKERTSTIINMDKTRYKHTKTKLKQKYDTRSYRRKKEMELTIDQKNKLEDIATHEGKVQAVLFLLTEGMCFCVNDLTKKYPILKKSNFSNIMQRIGKSPISKMINSAYEGRAKYYSMKGDFREIPYQELYKVMNNRFPDTMRDLARRYPKPFGQEEEYEEYEEYEKCPRCQQKSFVTTGETPGCVACGYYEKSKETKLTSQEEAERIAKKNLEHPLNYGKFSDKISSVINEHLKDLNVKVTVDFNINIKFN